MFSQALHALSRHTHFPFVAVNCAALSKHLLESELFGHGKGAFTGADHDRIGRFELVEEGTLLLDEIGDLEIPLQVKLLRVIEQRVFQRVGTNKDIRFKGRFISATCVDLDEAANNGEFRQDLLGRINQFRIKIPPLRERRGDVSLLSRHFLQKHAQNRLVELSPTALDVLEKYEFPRNIRQLENAIVFALARSDTLRTILPRHLPPEIFATQREAASSVPRYTVHISADLPYEKARKSALRQIDKIYLNMLLMKHNGNRSRAAEEAGIDRKTFSDRMDHTLENMEGPACDD
jgi:transcriptional regulator with PAS, ATPase and Fis domain